MPAYMGLNKFKNGEGITNIKKARKILNNKREELKSHKGSSLALNNELQYRPLVPSEMFLASTGNIFPIAELQDRLQQLEQDPNQSLLEKKVTLKFSSKEKSGVAYNIDNTNTLVPISKYPWSEKNRDGCVVLYEVPQVDKEGNVPKDLYVIGHDPYSSDSATGQSLSATYVVKTKAYWDTFGHDEIVAVYVGRPYDGRHVVNENLLKLSMMYGNAKVYFENVTGNVKEYFEKMKRLDLLAKTPSTVFSKKASYMGGPSHTYGYPMSSKTAKLDGLLYIRDWLIEPRMSSSGVTLRNLDRIWDKALIQELIAFNLDGNFDRVMGFLGSILGINEMFNQYEQQIKDMSDNKESYN